jgi:hypothetical protein
MIDKRQLAQRFWRDQVWTRLEGRKVRFERDVERDEFTVPTGSEGTIRTPFLDSEGGLVLAVLLDTPVAGSEPFEGEVHWREGVNIEEVEADLKLL